MSVLIPHQKNTSEHIYSLSMNPGTVSILGPFVQFHENKAAKPFWVQLPMISRNMRRFGLQKSLLPHAHVCRTWQVSMEKAGSFCSSADFG